MTLQAFNVMLALDPVVQIGAETLLTGEYDPLNLPGTRKVACTLEESGAESLNSGDIEVSVEEATVCSPPIPV